MNDFSKFPDPTYKEAVLAPLFEGVKRHHWRNLVAVNEAHGVMLGERDWLSPAQLGAILAAQRAVLAETDIGALTYTGEHEDFFFLLESALRGKLGPDLAGRLHTGRSRNDIDHTIFRMSLREHLLAILAQLEALIAVLLERAAAGAETLVVAYTHGQPAQPTTWGHYLGALIEILLRDAGRLLHALATVDCCALGAAAITTSGFKLDRERVAELLGFSAVQENSYGCIATADYIAETYASLKVMLLGLGRFIQDLNSWTGFETGHLRVPDAFVQISSIMPQKRNPVPVEHMRLLASLAAGQAEAVLTALHNTPFTDMNDSEGTVQEAGYEAFATTGRVLTLLAAFMRAVTIDEARVRRHIDEACVTITEVADSLVRREGISFRQAHEIASILARDMIAHGHSLATIDMTVFEAAFIHAIGRPPGIDEASFREIGTARHFVAVRDMLGGPAPSALAASLGRYRARLADIVAQAAAYRDRVARATVQRGRLVHAAITAIDGT